MKYAPRRITGGHLSADNGQGMGWSDTCTAFRCQEWRGGVPVAPVLEKRGQFWCCPRCRASYGTGPE